MTIQISKVYGGAGSRSTEGLPVAGLPSQTAPVRNLKKILLIRPQRIGDVVLSTPLVRALRAAYPRAQIHYLTGRPCDQVLQGNPHLDRIMAYPSDHTPWSYISIARCLRRANYDAVIDLEGTRTTARLTRITGAPIRIGYDAREPRWAYTHRIPEERTARYWARVQADLGQPLGVRVDSLETELFLTAADRARGTRILNSLGLERGDAFAAMVPGSEAAHKVWPAPYFAAVADTLYARHGLPTLLLFGPGEEPYVREVQERVRAPARCLVAPTPTLREAAAVLECSTLYIGNDVGTRHMAIALNIPSVGIFGRHSEQRWTPPQAPEHLTVAFDPGCKATCRVRRCVHYACIQNIPVSAVLERIELLLKGGPLSQPIPDLGMPDAIEGMDLLPVEAEFYRGSGL